MARIVTWLDEYWHRHDDFTVGSPEQKEQFCIPAQLFAAWGEGAVQTVLRNPTPISINQCKILLMDKFFAIRADLPKAHRNLASERSLHVCVFQVYERIYYRLRAEEFMLTPPLLFEPVQPQITKITNITKYDGFVLGKTVMDDDEDE